MDSRYRLTLVLVALGVAAAGMAGLASSPHPGVSVDSGEYLAVADGLRSGHGLTMPYVGYDEAYRIVTPGERIPMTQFPPLYPAVLAGTAEVAGISLEAAARALGVLAFGAFVLLGAYLVWRARRSILFTALGGALLLAPDLVTIHAMAWSEQLMLVALVGAVLFAARLVERRASADLVGLGLCCIASSMARFAGVSSIVAGAVVVAIAYGGPASARTRRAILFAAVTVAPTIAWFVRNSVVTGAVSEKEAAWHPPSLTVLGQAAQTIGGWVVPWRPATMAAGIAIAAAVAVLVARRRDVVRRVGRGSITDVCVLFGAAYALFLVLARTLMDQNIPFDTRLLSPLEALLSISLCIAVAGRARSNRRNLAFAAVVVLAVASLARGAVLSARFSETTVAAYTSDRWRTSETLAYARELPRATRVITNAPDPLWFWDDRVTQILPPRSSLYSGEPNENYSVQLNELLMSTRCTRAVLVFFSQPTRKPPREVDPVVAAGLRVTDPRELADGVVFELDEPPCPGADRVPGRVALRS